MRAFSEPSSFIAEMAPSSLSFSSTIVLPDAYSDAGVKYHIRANNDSQPVTTLSHAVLGELTVDEGSVHLTTQDGINKLFGQFVLNERRAGLGKVVGMDGGHLGGHFAVDHLVA